MRIGIIGASNLKGLLEINPDAKDILEKLSEDIIKKEIIVTPDKKSVSEFFAKIYLSKGGKKVYEILPLDDKEFGYKEWINIELGIHINCGTWRNQPEKFNEETDVLLCVGYAVGVLAEIAYSKWFKPKPVFIINELVSGKLPVEVERSLNLKYTSYKDFAEELRKIKQQPR